MQNSNYIQANVLLFDQTSSVLRQTMSVLQALGFKLIADAHELDVARNILLNQRLDVAVLAVESADCGVLDLVDDIRKRRCGGDPFLPILLTGSDARLQSVQRIIDSGADDLLMHPFSIAQMGERIEALAKARKPFVVTENYFGPDRRASSTIEADPSSIVVPNALLAQVHDRLDAAPSSARIETAFLGLQRLKLRNIARRIWYLANCLKESLLEPGLLHRYERELTKIRASIRAFQKSLLPDEDKNLPDLCDSVSDALATLFGQPPDTEGVELLEQKALALRVASKLAGEQSDSQDVVRHEKVAKINNVEVELVSAVMG
jgi:DNA-binding response OmpR family regulator